MIRMDRKERFETARRLRKEGKSLRQIGAELGVSPERVRQMLYQATRPTFREPNWTDGLCVRVASALQAHGFKDVEEVQRACERREITFVKSLGKKGMAEVYAWLGMTVEFSASQQKEIQRAIFLLERNGYRIEKVD